VDKYVGTSASGVRKYGLRKYGLTGEQYEMLLASQNGACAICHGSPPVGKSLNVDHDHDTGIVRGLLCTPCNTGLGFFKDRIRLLAAAIVYLQDHEVRIR
jgi:hypothetical protein